MNARMHQSSGNRDGTVVIIELPNRNHGEFSEQFLSAFANLPNQDKVKNVGSTSMYFSVFSLRMYIILNLTPCIQLVLLLRESGDLVNNRMLHSYQNFCLKPVQC